MPFDIPLRCEIVNRVNGRDERESGRQGEWEKNAKLIADDSVVPYFAFAANWAIQINWQMVLS
jgi:hypothetical protein